MMIRGVTAGRPPLDDVLVVDIGGGSTELVLAADGEVAFATSLDVGCVRITERFLGSDPPSRPELAAAGAYVRSLLPPLEAASAIGVAGTVTTLATLDLGDAEYDPARTHGHRLSLASVEEQLERLAAMTTRRARSRVPGHRARPRIGDRRRDRRPARGDDARTASPRSRCPSATSSTAPRSRPPSCPSPRRARRLPAPTPAADASGRDSRQNGRRAETARRSPHPRASAAASPQRAEPEQRVGPLDDTARTSSSARPPRDTASPPRRCRRWPRRAAREPRDARSASQADVVLPTRRGTPRRSCGVARRRQRCDRRPRETVRRRHAGLRRGAPRVRDVPSASALVHAGARTRRAPPTASTGTNDLRIAALARLRQRVPRRAALRPSRSASMHENHGRVERADTDLELSAARARRPSARTSSASAKTSSQSPSVEEGAAGALRASTSRAARWPRSRANSSRFVPRSSRRSSETVEATRARPPRLFIAIAVSSRARAESRELERLPQVVDARGIAEVRHVTMARASKGAE